MKDGIRRFSSVLSGMAIILAVLTAVPGVSLGADNLYSIGVNQTAPGYDHYCKTIQEAIDVAYNEYGSDDVVKIDVYPGEYFIRDEPGEGMIDIRQACPELQVKQFPTHAECVIRLYDVNSAVHIEKGSFTGFHIIRMDQDLTGSGIFITGQCTVKNCVIENFNVGIVGFCASNVTNRKAPVVVNCETMYNNNGMTVGEMNVIFKRNRIHHNFASGMNFGPGGSPQMFDNFIHHNKFGITIRTYPVWAPLAEISNNVIYKNGVGIYAVHNGYTGDSCEYAISSVVMDNVITGNTEWGIYCEDRIPQPSLYDYLLQLRNNNVWMNGDGMNNYWNCPTPIDSISVDPNLEIIDDWPYLGESSLCVDMGSRTLYPGTCVETLEEDISSVDLGYHQNNKPDPVFEELYTGHVWIVDQDAHFPYDFRTITEALRSPFVRAGDVIEVRKTRRPYYESLTIDKAVMIQSSHLSPEGRPQIATRLGAPGVVISAQAKLKHLEIMPEDFSIDPYPGIVMQTVSCVENCVIAKYSEGIVVETPQSVRIQYSEILCNYKTGVTLTNGSSAYLFSNWIAENYGTGILVRSSRDEKTRPFFANNTIWNNDGDGIYATLGAGDQGIGMVAMNNVIFSNDGFGYSSNRVYVEIDKNVAPPEKTYHPDNGIYIQMRNNDIWGNGDSVVPEDVRTNFGNKEIAGVEYWYTPMPNYALPDCWITPRIINHMSFAPMYNLSTRLLRDESECIDAGNFKLRPGDAQYMITDSGMVDIGAHQILIH